MKQDYLKKKKILLVDDEQEILYMVQGILAHEGYLNTRTAGTVREAMAAWKEWKPELVLLDVCCRTEMDLNFWKQPGRFQTFRCCF